MVPDKQIALDSFPFPREPSKVIISGFSYFSFMARDSPSLWSACRQLKRLGCSYNNPKIKIYKGEGPEENPGDRADDLKKTWGQG